MYMLFNMYYFLYYSYCFKYRNFQMVNTIIYNDTFHYIMYTNSIHIYDLIVHIISI